MRKRSYLSLLLILSLLLSLCVVPASAAEAWDTNPMTGEQVAALDIPYFEQPDGTIALGISDSETTGSYKGGAASLNLPSSIDGKRVTRIAECAFYAEKTLTSVVLPNSLLEIGDNAFGSSGLISVVIPDGVTSIGSRAFGSCKSLSHFVIPASVSSTGAWNNGPFVYCDSLASAGPIGSGCSIEFGWTDTIPAYVFFQCTGLKSAILPDGLKVIPVQLFELCDLRSITIFCNENALEPTIHTVSLKYNALSDRFEGTLTLKANTYTIRDFPYGFTFDYTTTRPGSSAAPERPPFSAEQLVDTLEAQAAQREQWASDMASNVFEFYDPDDVEFTLENTEGLTDEQKEMFRVLLSISNDLYTMQEEAVQNNAAVVADRYGEEVLSDSPVESVQKITSSVSDQTECAAIPEGSTSADALLGAGYEEINTSYGDFYLDMEDSGAATVVDLQNLLSTAVSMDSTERDLETTIEYFAPSFFTLVHTTLDLAIASVEKAADFYSNLLIRKLGLEGNIDRLDDTIAKYKTYLGLLEDPITWKSGDYGKDLKTISLEIVEELEELEQTRKQIDEFKKTLKSFKADLAQTEKSIHLANLERPNLHKYLPAFQFMNSGAGKVLSFAVLDLYGILVSAIGVVDAIDVARARENTIENAQDRADRMLAYSNGCISQVRRWTTR